MNENENIKFETKYDFGHWEQSKPSSLDHEHASIGHCVQLNPSHPRLRTDTTPHDYDRI